VPSNRAAFAITIDGHAACDRHAITQLERATGFATHANAIEEILEMRLRDVRRTAHNFLQVGTIYLLRNIADLAGAHYGPMGAEHIFRHSQLVVSQARSPVD